MNEAWGVLAAVLSSGLGGTSVAATRYLVNAIDPLAIGSFRFGIGFLLLLPAALLQGGRWPPRRDWSGVAGLGGAPRPGPKPRAAGGGAPGAGGIPDRPPNIIITGTGLTVPAGVTTVI